MLNIFHLDLLISVNGKLLIPVRLIFLQSILSDYTYYYNNINSQSDAYKQECNYKKKLNISLMN